MVTFVPVFRPRPFPHPSGARKLEGFCGEYLGQGTSGEALLLVSANCCDIVTAGDFCPCVSTAVIPILESKKDNRKGLSLLLGIHKQLLHSTDVENLTVTFVPIF